MMQPRIYNGITPEKLETLRERARKAHLDLTGTQGTAELRGCKFLWMYTMDNEQLTIQCTSKPLYVSEKTIKEQLDKLLA